MKKLTSIAFLLFFTVSISFAQTKKSEGPLDKKNYICEFTEDGKKKPKGEKDELKFMAGKFNCKFMNDEGFKGTAYTATVDGDKTEFTVEATNDKGETIKWEGTIVGNDISGTVTISKKEKVKSSYTFSGALREKKPAAKYPM